MKFACRWRHHPAHVHRNGAMTIIHRGALPSHIQVQRLCPMRHDSWLRIIQQGSSMSATNADIYGRGGYSC